MFCHRVVWMKKQSIHERINDYVITVIKIIIIVIIILLLLLLLTTSFSSCYYAPMAYIKRSANGVGVETRVS